MDEELEHAIIKLNEAFFGGETPMDFLGFDYRSNGYSEAVYFLGVRIWMSDDDDRIWNDETGEYEPFIEYLKRQAIDVLDKLKPVRRRLTTAST